MAIVAQIIDPMVKPTMGTRTQRLFASQGSNQSPDYSLAVAKQSGRQKISQETLSVYNALQAGYPYDQLEVATGLSRNEIGRSLQQLKSFGVVELVDNARAVA